MINDLNSIISKIIFIFIEEIRINILYHLNRKKINDGNPEILIIIIMIIIFIKGVNLIQEEKFESE